MAILIVQLASQISNPFCRTWAPVGDEESLAVRFKIDKFAALPGRRNTSALWRDKKKGCVGEISDRLNLFHILGFPRKIFQNKFLRKGIKHEMVNMKAAIAGGKI